MGSLAAKDEILRFSDSEEIGGQTFGGFPETAPEVGAAWASVFFEATKDLIAPTIVVPPFAAQAAWAATMTPLVNPLAGGLDAFAQAASVAFLALSASITPNLIASPPPASFTPPVSITSDPVAPASAFASALAGWLATATWTPPGPPAPLPFQVAP